MNGGGGRRGRFCGAGGGLFVRVRDDNGMLAPVELILLARGEGIVAIQPCQRIGALAVEDNLKMQVRPENIARDAAVPDDVTLLDLLTVLDAIAG